jgi:hypothetical protein
MRLFSFCSVGDAYRPNFNLGDDKDTQEVAVVNHRHHHHRSFRLRLNNHCALVASVSDELQRLERWKGNTAIKNVPYFETLFSSLNDLRVVAL